jgi:regulator of replication initiation timing
MLVCDTCNVEWDADEVIRELKGENNDLKAKNNALAFQNSGLELENERLRGALSSIAEDEGTLGWGGYTPATRIAKTALKENNNG